MNRSFTRVLGAVGAIFVELLSSEEEKREEISRGRYSRFSPIFSVVTEFRHPLVWPSRACRVLGRSGDMMWFFFWCVEDQVVHYWP